MQQWYCAGIIKNINTLGREADLFVSTVCPNGYSVHSCRISYVGGSIACCCMHPECLEQIDGLLPRPLSFGEQCRLMTEFDENSGPYGCLMGMSIVRGLTPKGFCGGCRAEHKRLARAVLHKVLLVRAMVPVADVARVICAILFDMPIVLRRHP
jgi:hypothetical protein